MRRLVGVLAAAALAVGILAAPAAAKGDRNTTAAAIAALKAQLTEVSNGQFGLEWKMLHPLQQAFIPQAVYVTCAAKNAHGIQLTGITVKGTNTEPVLIPGTSVTAPSTAITVALSTNRGVQTVTLHEFYVKRKWRYTVSNPAIYKAGC